MDETRSLVSSIRFQLYSTQLHDIRCFGWKLAMSSTRSTQRILSRWLHRQRRRCSLRWICTGSYQKARQGTSRIWERIPQWVWLVVNASAILICSTITDLWHWSDTDFWHWSQGSGSYGSCTNLCFTHQNQLWICSNTGIFELIKLNLEAVLGCRLGERRVKRYIPTSASLCSNTYKDTYTATTLYYA